MKKTLCLILAVCLLGAMLSGCGSLEDLLAALYPGRDTAFGDMEYQKPNLEALRSAFAQVEEAAPEATDLDTLVELINNAYTQYYDFYTAYALAQIHYSADLTQESWAEESEFCSGFCAEVDALLDNMFYTLADSPLKEKLEGEAYFGSGFFDDYTGESLWDDTFTAMMEQDSQLQVRYYELSSEALESGSYQEYYEVYGTQMADVYVEMVKLRRQIAAYAGYGSYSEFAYDFLFDRDYTPRQAVALLTEIRQELVPLYKQTADGDFWDAAYEPSTEEETFAYVKDTVDILGGTVGKAFELMQKFDLYDLTYSENKFDSSFTVYLLNYDEPYIFVNPTACAQDKLTFVHEFGHFCNDFATYGNVVSVDVAEVFSQGMEYLSLCCRDTGDLERYKLADGLSVYVEQAAYAAFEEGVYAMEDPTREKVCALFSDTMDAYGLDIWDVDPLAFVSVPHFFTEPMYVVSYVVSNDAAFQLYQMEQQEKGSGVKLYQDSLSSTEPGFLAFVEQAGLESPFTEGRIRSVKETLEEMLA